MTAAADRRWAVGASRRLGPDRTPEASAAVVARRVAVAIGPHAVEALAVTGLRLEGDVETAHGLDVLDGVGEPGAGWADPWLVGQVHEQAANPDERRRRGAWYTPRSVVGGLTIAAFEAWGSTPPPLVVDPTCGGGAFLLAALDRLVAMGVPPEAAVGRTVGLDLDPTAVRVTRWSLALWAAAAIGDDGAGGIPPALGAALGAIDIRCGDAVTDLAAAWPDPMVVVGNPPFATPLKAGTVPASAAALRSANDELLGPYADLGAIHLVNALAVAADRPGSVVALVQPQSILAGRDTGGLRRRCHRERWLVGLWAARQALFDAGLRPCAPVLRIPRHGDSTPRTADDEVALYHGPHVTTGPRRPLDGWGPLAADALGAPALPPLDGRTLDTLVAATAGFRDEHYALVAACREWPIDRPAPDGGCAPARVVTVGAVDPLVTDWGVTPFRFGGALRERPVVDREALPPKVQRWFDRVRGPKVLLATQAKLLEPVVDRAGATVPATPLIAVTADPVDLDRVAAVFLAPPVVLWAWRTWFGTALSVDAVKPAARQVGALPLPDDHATWEKAAELVAGADGLGQHEAWDRADAVAALMNDAYGASPEVLAWWRGRRKPRPPDPGGHSRPSH